MMYRVCVGLVLIAALAGCASQAPAPDYQALVASTDRSDADRVNDVRRKPVPFLAFMDVRPGMTVADISSGGGYTTELLARAVGPTGRVYAHNLKPRLEERMKKPAMKNVVEVVGPFENPFPPEVRNLDLVTFNFNYHDTTYMGVDRAKMNSAVFAALKPGGHYIVADHSALPGAGVERGEIIAPHRREHGAQRSRGGRLQAGRRRRLSAQSGRPRTAPVTNPAQPNDEFVLKFVKP